MKTKRFLEAPSARANLDIFVEMVREAEGRFLLELKEAHAFDASMQQNHDFFASNKSEAGCLRLLRRDNDVKNSLRRRLLKVFGPSFLKKSRFGLIPALTAFLLIASSPFAGKAEEMAQNYTRPPADLGNNGSGYDSPPQENAAGFLIRIDRLENQIRQLNGQVEQLQFANHRLEDQLKKFQADVDFRFQEGNGRQGGAQQPAAPAKVQPKRTELLPGDYEMGVEAQRPAEYPVENELPQNGAGVNETHQHRHDAFDPYANPAAPGAPLPLGTYAGSPAPAGETDPDAPLDLAGGRLAPKLGHDNQVTGMSAAVPPPLVQDKAAVPAAPQTQTRVAALPPNPQKDDFAAALGLFRQKEYENAGKGFTAFLQKNPQSKLSADALYYLGETYFQRGRQREAAEEFLKISTHYASSARAPEAMLRLGQSLLALGAHEQACATFGEVPHKYPNAAVNVKAGAEREAKRAQC